MTQTKKLAIAGAALFAWLAVPSAAVAQTPVDCQRDPYNEVCGRQVGNQQLRQDPRVAATETETETEESESSDTLPVTGGDLLGLTAIGLGAVGAGTVFVRRSRRTT